MKRGSGGFVELDKKAHCRESFDCGDKELNSFIKERAANQAESKVNKTYVLPAGETQADGKAPICAFYTISISTIRRESLPKEHAKKLPAYPVPAILIAQLAVDQKHQKKRLGELTLVAALRKINDVVQLLPACAMIVDCHNDRSSFYTQYGFLFLEEHNGKARLFLPMAQVGALFP